MIKFIKELFKNNNIISLVSTGLNTIFVALSFWLLIRTYSKEVTGQWIIYSTSLQFIDMIRSGLLFTALIKFLSGCQSDEEKKELIGSAWILGFFFSFIIIIFSYIIFFLFKVTFVEKDFLLFFQIFPISFLTLLPVSISISTHASNQNFLKILIIRLGSSLPMLIFLILNLFIFKFNIFYVALIQVGTMIPIVLFCILEGSSGIHYIFKSSKNVIRRLINFGKYSMLTSLAANLLRSSDIYIIGLFLTNSEVAIYSIPLKIINIFETGLNSFCDVAMPMMSKEAGVKNITGIRHLFYKYSGFVSLLLIPAVILFFIIAKPIIWIIGGSKYMDNPEIFYVLFIFLISFLLQPLDRFSGVALDSINRPGVNLFKVIIMASVNIIGDIIVINIFKSISAVAFVTLINVISGVIFGLIFLKKEININISEYSFCLFTEIKNIIINITTKKNIENNYELSKKE